MDTLIHNFITGLRIMDGHGLTEAFGHLSTRLEDPSKVLITPAKGPGIATADELLTFSTEGACMDSNRAVPPALETPMHLAIYRSRPDVTAICRTHSPYAVSYGVLNKALPTAHGFGLMLGTRIPCHAESDLIHTDSMGNDLANTLAQSNGLLICGNGALAVGTTLQQAVVRALYLEEAARIALHALQCNVAIGWSPSKAQQREHWHDKELQRTWDYFAQRYGTTT